MQPDKYLHVDFETASELELNDVGVHAYAEHESTRILCMSWWMPGRDEPYVWFPGQPLPPSIGIWCGNGRKLSAWSAQFEKVIWTLAVHKHGFPRVTDDQWYDPQALARSRNLPGSLYGAGKALGAEVLKDKSARKLMLAAARGEDVDMGALGRYCATDVRSEHAIQVKLGDDMEQREREIYRVSERINDRGIAIDYEFVFKAARAVDAYQKNIAREMQDAFGIAPTQVQRIGEFCRKHRVHLSDLQADTVDEVLDYPDFYPEPVLQILRMRQLGAAVSPKKYAAMLRAVNLDNRIRGMFVYSGAGQTRRWSARIVQWQNLPRPTLPYSTIRAAMEALRRDDDWRALLPYGDPLDVLLNAIRPSVVAGNGGLLTAGDESAIEARVLPWLAGDRRTLGIFRSGTDVYLHTAAGIPGADRQIGKVATLSLGYQGGKDAFRKMGRNYGVIVQPAEAERIKVAWRAEHPEIVALWYALQDAAMNAITNPGKHFDVGALTFVHNGSALWMRLPSGGALCYWGAHLRMTTPKWEMEKPEELRKQKLTICFWAPKGDGMVLDFTYGGKLTENATQAVARDVIGEAMIREPKLPYILHAHDELVAEGDHVARLHTALTTPMPWARDLPLKADMATMDRYRKKED